MLTRLNDSSPVIVDGCRTPFLRSGTDFKDMLTYDLARMALKGLIDKADLPSSEIEHVIFGCVLSEPQTSNIAREALIGANLPVGIPAHTVSMACISGSQAISQAAGLIAGAQADTVIAGGVESLSNVPILLKRAMRRKLIEMRRLKTPVAWIRWVLGLRPGYFLPEIPEIAEFSNGLTMGRSSDRLAARWGVSREEQAVMRYGLTSLPRRRSATACFRKSCLPWSRLNSRPSKETMESGMMPLWKNSPNFPRLFIPLSGRQPPVTPLS